MAFDAQPPRGRLPRLPNTLDARIGRFAALLVPWTLVACFAACVTWIALSRHAVGDYGAESDFYGGYAQGALQVQRGVWDPARAIVVGPVYESALAVAGRLAPDLFIAAKLLSVASAVGVLGLWLVAIRRRVGAGAAAWVTAFLAANPVFVRHAYAASTDMLALFLQSACAFALLTARARVGLLGAGMLAGFATLTRYSSAYLVPGAWIGVFWLESREPRRAAGAAAWFTLGFLVVVAPWLAHSLSSGVVPGQQLVRAYGFYANAVPGGNPQDAVVAPGQEPAPFAAFGEVIAADPAAFAMGLARAVPDHLSGDAGRLLGWPAALALLLGGLGLARSGRGSALRPILILGGCAFVTLLGAFHSERYSLALAPFYAALAAGFAVATADRAGGRLGLVLGRTAGGAALLLTIGLAARVQSDAMRLQPEEVVPAARALADQAPAEARVISRKGHIGYYSGLEVVPFPRFRTLRELAAHARRHRAEFLYYSWYETQLRPEFRYLLDTTAAIPGLSVVHAGGGKPAVVYRIGPDFGRSPDWIADDFRRSLHEARAMVGVEGARAAPEHHRVLALDALLHGRWDEALGRARATTAVAPGDAAARTFEGEALRRLGRNDEARAAFVRAMGLDPAEPAPAIGLGRIELAAGNRERAAHLFRSAARATKDAEVLGEISRLLGAVADTAGVREVRQAIGRIAAGRGDRLASAGGGRIQPLVGRTPFCGQPFHPASRAWRKRMAL